jgi:hypothetical protein
MACFSQGQISWDCPSCTAVRSRKTPFTNKKQTDRQSNGTYVERPNDFSICASHWLWPRRLEEPVGRPIGVDPTKIKTNRGSHRTSFTHVNFACTHSVLCLFKWGSTGRYQLSECFPSTHTHRWTKFAFIKKDHLFPSKITSQQLLMKRKYFLRRNESEKKWILFINCLIFK